MFPRALNQCSNVKRRLFCSNQRIFVGRLPIDFFYFEDFEWSFFGKIRGQKQRNRFIKNGKNYLNKEQKILLDRQCLFLCTP